MLASLAALLAAPRAARAQLAVDPLELHLGLAADQRTGIITVSNPGTQPVQAKIYLNDWDRTAAGSNRFYPSRALPQSCGAMLDVFPLTLRLEPNASQAVRVVLQHADSLRAACWSIVFIETVPLPTSGGTHVSYIMRTGTKVYVEPAGLARDGAIEGMTARAHVKSAPADSAVRDVVIRFHNTGGVQVLPKGTLELRRPDNSVAARVAIDEFPVLPGAEREVSVPVPPLPPGRYVALGILDFGGAEVVGGQMEYEVP